MRDKEISFDRNLAKYVKTVLFSTVIGVFCAAVVMAFFSFLFVKTGNYPVLIIDGLVLSVSALSTLVSGYVSARIIKNNGLIWGLVSGCAMFFVLFFSGLMFSDGKISTVVLLKLTLMILSGTIGGIIGVNKRSKR